MQLAGWALSGLMVAGYVVVGRVRMLEQFFCGHQHVDRRLVLNVGLGVKGSAGAPQDG